MPNVFAGFIFKRPTLQDANSEAIATDGNNILHAPLVKHYNVLLERQSSELGKDEVSYFDVGGRFLYTPWD